MTSPLKGRKQTPEHIAARVLALQPFFESRRGVRDPDVPLRKKASLAAWKKANAERVRSYHAAWREANKERIASYAAEYSKANRGVLTARQNERYVRAKRAIPPWADLDAIRGMYELCAVFRRVGLDLHVDHIIPLTGKLVSGLHVEWNLQLLHSRANFSKKNRLLDEVAG